jgi:hypothetical protein
VPLKFWDEAFVTAVYLINRLPSHVINQDTLFERLFHTKPDYSDLQTFGCACWPNLHPYNTQKLAFRSTQCVFLGCSNLHKGFMCLEVKSGHVYISRNVVFNETMFPFANLHPNAVARLRAEISLLPDTLTNLIRDDNTFDPFVNSAPTNDVLEVSDVVQEPSTEKLEYRDSIPGENGRHFMSPLILSQIGHNTGHEADLPAIPAAASALNQAMDSVTVTTPVPATPNSPRGASPTSQPTAASLSPMGVGATDGSSFSFSTPSESASASAQPRSSMAPNQSAAPIGASAPAAPVAPPAPQRPNTHLQHGIHTPKVYTDGTIKYGNLASTSEPSSVVDALRDPTWKAAMNSEFEVPPQHGKILLIANGCLRSNAMLMAHSINTRLVWSLKGIISGMASIMRTHLVLLLSVDGENPST